MAGTTTLGLPNWPEDVLSSLMSFLTLEHINKLKLCGSAELNRKLTHEHVLLDLMVDSFAGFPFEGSLAPVCPHLRSLTINFFQMLGQKSNRWLMELPKTITRLNFEFPQALSIWNRPAIPGTDHWVLCSTNGFTAVSVRDLLPNLLHLRLHGDWARAWFVPTSDLPFHVFPEDDEDMVWVYWTEPMRVAFLKQLPLNLASLELDTRVELPARFFPPRLEKLVATRGVYNALSIAKLGDQLPPEGHRRLRESEAIIGAPEELYETLTQLEWEPLHFSGLVVDQLERLSSLTWLSLPNGTPEMFRKLPQTLRTLKISTLKEKEGREDDEFDSGEDDMGEDDDEQVILREIRRANATEPTFQATDLALLPQSLTSLTILFLRPPENPASASNLNSFNGAHKKSRPKRAAAKRTGAQSAQDDVNATSSSSATSATTSSTSVPSSTSSTTETSEKNKPLPALLPPNLKYLALLKCRGDWVLEVQLQTLGTYLKDIEHFRFTLMPESFHRIATTYFTTRDFSWVPSSLVHLELESATPLPPHIFTTWPQSCSRIATLELSGLQTCLQLVDDSAAHFPPSLTRLIMSNTDEITPDFLQYAQPNLQRVILPHMRNLGAWTALRLMEIESFASPSMQPPVLQERVHVMSSDLPRDLTVIDHNTLPNWLKSDCKTRLLPIRNLRLALEDPDLPPLITKIDLPKLRINEFSPIWQLAHLKTLKVRVISNLSGPMESSGPDGEEDNTPASLTSLTVVERWDNAFDMFPWKPLLTLTELDMTGRIPDAYMGAFSFGALSKLQKLRFNCGRLPSHPTPLATLRSLFSTLPASLTYFYLQTSVFEKYIDVDDSFLPKNGCKLETLDLSRSEMISVLESALAKMSPHLKTFGAARIQTDDLARMYASVPVGSTKIADLDLIRAICPSVETFIPPLNNTQRNSRRAVEDELETDPNVLEGDMNSQGEEDEYDYGSDMDMGWPHEYGNDEFGNDDGFNGRGGGRGGGFGMMDGDDDEFDQGGEGDDNDGDDGDNDNGNGGGAAGLRQFLGPARAGPRGPHGPGVVWPRLQLNNGDDDDDDDDEELMEEEEEEGFDSNDDSEDDSYMDIPGEEAPKPDPSNRLILDNDPFPRLSRKPLRKKRMRKAPLERVLNSINVGCSWEDILTIKWVPRARLQAIENQIAASSSSISPSSAAPPAIDAVAVSAAMLETALQLELDRLSVECVQALPRTLTEWNAIHFWKWTNAHCLALPPMITSMDILSIDLDCHQLDLVWPATLTSLAICAKSDERNSFGPKRASASDGFCARLPSGLIHLRIDVLIALSDENILALPRGILQLIVPDVEFATTRGLPPTLQYLEALSFQNADCVAHLPLTLQYLRLQEDLDQDIVPALQRFEGHLVNVFGGIEADMAWGDEGETTTTWAEPILDRLNKL